MTRSLLLLLLPFIALLAVPPLGSSGSAAVLGTAIAVFVVAALATSSKYELLQLCAVSATGPSDDERCLRGAFRRQSSPDAPVVRNLELRESVCRSAVGGCELVVGRSDVLRPRPFPRSHLSERAFR